MDKDVIVAAINHRLAMQTGRRHFEEQEHEAPVIHSVIACIVDAVNEELGKLEAELEKLRADR